jgi:hypothetical protein
LFLPLRSTIFLALLIVGLALLAVSPDMHRHLTMRCIESLAAPRFRFR